MSSKAPRDDRPRHCIHGLSRWSRNPIVLQRSIGVLRFVKNRSSLPGHGVASMSAAMAECNGRTISNEELVAIWCAMVETMQKMNRDLFCKLR